MLWELRAGQDNLIHHTSPGVSFELNRRPPRLSKAMRAHLPSMERLVAPYGVGLSGGRRLRSFWPDSSSHIGRQVAKWRDQHYFRPAKK